MSVPNLKSIVSASTNDEVKTDTTASTTNKDASGDEHETKTADDEVERGWRIVQRSQQ